MTREMGKPLTETRGDVQEGIDTAYYAATEGRRLFGHTVPSEMRNKWAMSFRRPIGVCGIITPFNFPMAIPTWKMFPALLCGNACIFKPAEDVPHTGTRARRDHARGGAAARSDPARARPRRDRRRGDRRTIRAFRSISFTGSTETGRIVGETCGRMHKRLSLEMGGKNAMIVFDDADLDLALEGVLWGAFGTTGQRCTATSRLSCRTASTTSSSSRLVDRARGAQARRRPQEGHGRRAAHQRGVARRRSSATSTSARRRAPICCAAARVRRARALDNGYFFEPTIFARVRAGHAPRAGRDLRPGALRGSRSGRRRGVRDQQRREVRPVVVGLHARRERRDARA